MSTPSLSPVPRVVQLAGSSPADRHIRLTADWLSPDAAAMARVVQWSRPAGGGSLRVRARTSRTCASVIFLGVPGRGMSRSPASRAAANRARHLATVARETPAWAATRVSGWPSAQARTIAARAACRPLVCAAHSVSRFRSPVLSTSGSCARAAMRTAYGAKAIFDSPGRFRRKQGQGPRDEVAGTAGHRGVPGVAPPGQHGQGPRQSRRDQRAGHRGFRAIGVRGVPG